MVRRLSNAAKLNVAGLVLTAAGMLVQIAAGSELYPSLAGPIVLLVTAVFVAVWPRRWVPTWRCSSRWCWDWGRSSPPS